MNWLVGCFGFNGPLRQYGRLPKRGRKRREKIDQSKNDQTTPTRTYYKHSRPLPYYHPNCRTPRYWRFTQDHRSTPNKRVKSIKLKYLHFIKETWTEKKRWLQKLTWTKRSPLGGPWNSNYETKMADAWICKIFLIAYVNTALQRLIMSNAASVKSRLAADWKSWNSITIDATFGVCFFCYIGLKGLKRRNFRPHHDKGK